MLGRVQFASPEHSQMREPHVKCIYGAQSINPSKIFPLLFLLCVSYIVVRCPGPPGLPRDKPGGQGNKPTDPNIKMGIRQSSPGLVVSVSTEWQIHYRRTPLSPSRVSGSGLCQFCPRRLPSMRYRSDCKMIIVGRPGDRILVLLLAQPAFVSPNLLMGTNREQKVDITSVSCVKVCVVSIVCGVRTSM